MGFLDNDISPIFFLVVYKSKCIFKISNPVVVMVVVVKI